jgi:branched-chain amino acid transport system permease protein
MEYVGHVLVITGIYVVLAVSLDLLAGQTGLLSIAQAGFYGIGAYTSALLSVHFGWSFWVGTLAGMVVAGLISFMVTLPTARLHDDYFVIASFGFQMILFTTLNNWMSITRGPLGIPGIAKPGIFGIRIQSQWGFVVLAAAFVAFAVFVVHRLSASPLGRVLRGIPEDEAFVQAMGKNPLRFKITAFAVSAALAASAGSLYAHYVSYIAPTSFTVLDSILVISMVIIGGAGSLAGPIVGAIVLVLLLRTLNV